jgi:hypothetical protein
MSTPEQPATDQPVNLWPDWQPRKPDRIGLRIGIVALVIVVAVGATVFALLRAGAGEPNAVASPTQTTATPTDTPTPTPTPTFTPYTGGLADLFLPLPPGAAQGTLPYLTPDMTNAQRVSMIWNRQDPSWMSNLLTTHHFSRSMDRAWQSGATGVILILLQFSSPGNAMSWYQEASTTGFNGPYTESTASTIVRSLIVSRYATVKLSDGTRELIGVAPAGQFAILVDVGTATTQTDFPTLQDVADGQYQRLPRA